MAQKPTYRAQVVTASDSANLSPPAEAFMCTTTSGDIAVLLDDGVTTVTFKSVPLNTVVPVRVNRIKATNTTATGLLSLHLPNV